MRESERESVRERACVRERERERERDEDDDARPMVVGWCGAEYMSEFHDNT